ncbi:MAG: cupredoxin domain-containing protein, partial [Actinomycetota bacterium]|nr:cupredoxin domain-containing protein [Actinomycetota bacterium]
PQPAAATAEAPAATATQLAPEQRPAGVTHGTPSGNRLRPEDSVGTDTQFDGQQAMYRRRKMIDELVATGVPAVTAADAGRTRSASPVALLLYLLIFAGAVAFLIGQKDTLAGAAGEPEPGPGPGAGGLSISAEGSAFDTKELALPAGEETELEFANNDSLQHNVAIYEEEGGADLFTGQVIPGGQTTTYSIPPLESGTYYFQCDLHPSMNGDVVVEA